MKITSIESSVYRVPTVRPEADGTIAWDSTTMVIVEATAENGESGLGYSYAAAAAGELIGEMLANPLIGMDTEDVGAAWDRMIYSVRNVGRPGIGSAAISAVDIALWDLKARLAGKALFELLGPHRRSVPIYGSGGFTTDTLKQLTDQLAGWVEQGIPRVKMKIGKDFGTRPQEDIERIRAARKAIGPDAELFVDANGAYSDKQAIDLAQRFAEMGVSYFEEPVPFDFLKQLAFIRQRIPMDLASGEYGYDPYKFRDVLAAGAVDIMQADATRCMGVTGCRIAADLAFSHGIRFSTHTAPTVHAHVGCAVPQISHLEYFYDHVRIEDMFFDGVLRPREGALYPDSGRPGLGVQLKRQAAEPYRIA